MRFEGFRKKRVKNGVATLGTFFPDFSRISLRGKSRVNSVPGGLGPMIIVTLIASYGSSSGDPADL